MLNPLSVILIKIFVRGFYRNHAGALLFFFITIVSYCFFIQVLNETHLDAAERIKQNLLFILTLLTSPPLLIVVFLVWIGFTIKSYKYSLMELALPINQFFFYSSTALPKVELFKCWLVAQMLISLPLTLFASFSLVVGIVYHQYLTPIVIFGFILALNLITAFFLTIHFYKQVDNFQSSFTTRLTLGWRKPFWSLFIYHAISNLPLTVFLTKLFSMTILFYLGYFLANAADGLKVGGLMTLGISVAHSFLLFESARFEGSAISFVRNFPWSRPTVYLNWVLTITIFFIPEIIWLIIVFRGNAFILILFSLSVCLLFRNILYKIEVRMKAFLYWVFCFFAALFIAILFNLIWVTVPLVLITSWVLFKTFYYGRHPFSN